MLISVIYTGEPTTSMCIAYHNRRGDGDDFPYGGDGADFPYGLLQTRATVTASAGRRGAGGIVARRALGCVKSMSIVKDLNPVYIAN